MTFQRGNFDLCFPWCGQCDPPPCLVWGGGCRGEKGGVGMYGGGKEGVCRGEAV